MKRLALLVVFLLSLCAPASAQSNVQWLGPITAGNCVTWFVPGIIKDAGIGCVQAVAPGGSNGQIQYNNAGVFGGFTMSGDCTIVVSTGIITCPKTNVSLVNGRLTLASSVPVMGPTSCGGSPCANQGTIYADCYNGKSVPYYNGTTDLVDSIANCEVSSAMQTSGTGVLNANDVFDIWWVHSGANRICAATNGSGAGWSGDTGGSITARGTGYTQLDRSRGYLTNTNIIAHCYNGATDYGPVPVNQATYLGTIATTSSAGKVSYVYGSSASGGGAAFYGVWNYYNRVRVSTVVIDNGTSYTYSSATVRQARGSSENQVQYVAGVSEDGFTATYSTNTATAAALNAFTLTGVGLDATNAFAPGCTPSFIWAPTAAIMAGGGSASCALATGVGIHTISANEKSDGTNANTFDSNGSTAPNGLSVSLSN